MKSHKVQGYVFSKTISLDAFEHLLALEQRGVYQMKEWMAMGTR